MFGIIRVIKSVASVGHAGWTEFYTGERCGGGVFLTKHGKVSVCESLMKREKQGGCWEMARGVSQSDPQI
jgi:Leu/Phe-tRNA-protein transferase